MSLSVSLSFCLSIICYFTVQNVLTSKFNVSSCLVILLNFCILIILNNYAEDSVDLERANTELSRLRRRNTILSHRLSSSSMSSSLDSDMPPKLEPASDSSDQLRERSNSYRGSVLTSTEEDGFESVTVSPDIRGTIWVRGAFPPLKDDCPPPLERARTMVLPLLTLNQLCLPLSPCTPLFKHLPPLKVDCPTPLNVLRLWFCPPPVTLNQLCLPLS